MRNTHKIDIDKPAAREHAEVCWSHVPRVGDTVDLSEVDGPTGVVADVVWFDDTVRVVLR